jgi:hypothetical protein
MALSLWVSSKMERQYVCVYLFVYVCVLIKYAIVLGPAG